MEPGTQRRGAVAVSNPPVAMTAHAAVGEGGLHSGAHMAKMERADMANAHTQQQPGS
jgi:hypothetical protein